MSELETAAGAGAPAERAWSAVGCGCSGKASVFRTQATLAPLRLLRVHSLVCCWVHCWGLIAACCCCWPVTATHCGGRRRCANHLTATPPQQNTTQTPHTHLLADAWAQVNALGTCNATHRRQLQPGYGPVCTSTAHIQKKQSSPQKTLAAPSPATGTRPALLRTCDGTCKGVGECRGLGTPAASIHCGLRGRCHQPVNGALERPWCVDVGVVEAIFDLTQGGEKVPGRRRGRAKRICCRVRL